MPVHVSVTTALTVLWCTLMVLYLVVRCAHMGSLLLPVLVNRVKILPASARMQVWQVLVLVLGGTLERRLLRMVNLLAAFLVLRTLGLLLVMARHVRPGLVKAIMWARQGHVCALLARTGLYRILPVVRSDVMPVPMAAGLAKAILHVRPFIVCPLDTLETLGIALAQLASKGL